MHLLFLETLSFFAFSCLGLCALLVTGMQSFSRQAGEAAAQRATTTVGFWFVPLSYIKE